MKEESKPLRVVLDTNVLISALGFQGKTKRIWELAEAHQFQLFLSPFILEEFERNLTKKTELPAEEIALLLEDVHQLADIVNPKAEINVIDEKQSDNRILECAVFAKADVLVTGDMRHIRPLGMFQGVEILTPAEFLSKFFPK